VLDDRPVDDMVTLTPLLELPPASTRTVRDGIRYRAAACYAQKDGGSVRHHVLVNVGVKWPVGYSSVTRQLGNGKTLSPLRGGGGAVGSRGHG